MKRLVTEPTHILKNSANSIDFIFNNQPNTTKSFAWSCLFSAKNGHEQVERFTKTLLNIFHNFIPNKIILCDDKYPPWMIDDFKTLIKRKNWLF